MGSFQQVSIGVVCLVAAFAFGNYVNKHPSGGDHPLAENVNADSQTLPTGNVQSRLTNSALDVVDKRPAPIASMRKALKPRFSMPLDSKQANVSTQAENRLPPPSQLGNNNSSIVARPELNLKKRISETAQSTNATDVPDFSSIAAEFRNAPIEMRKLGSMPSHAGPVAGINPPTNLAPINAPSQNRELATAANPAVTPKLSSATNAWSTPPMPEGFSAIDFTPDLKGQFAAPPQPVEAPSSSETSNQPSNQWSRISKMERPPVVNSNFEQPVNESIVTQRSNQVISRQALPPEPFRGTLNPSSDYAPTAAQNSNRVKTMLPFGLTDQAKGRLAAIRSSANSRISLNTTQFVDHVIQPGETLQSISNRYFGKPDFYLDIYLANRNTLRNPADARQGMMLKIPVYE